MYFRAQMSGKQPAAKQSGKQPAKKQPATFPCTGNLFLILFSQIPIEFKLNIIVLFCAHLWYKTCSYINNYLGCPMIFPTKGNLTRHLPLCGRRAKKAASCRKCHFCGAPEGHFFGDVHDFADHALLPICWLSIQDVRSNYPER